MSSQMAIDLKKDIEVEKEILQKLAANSRLLVACDFDGTISAFTQKHDLAVIDPNARIAIRKLSELPNTFVTVISGRSLLDLSSKFADLDKVRLIGSHGHEFDVDCCMLLTNLQISQMEKATTIINDFISKCAGSYLEKKPHGLVFHYRIAKDISKNLRNQLITDLSNLECGIVRTGHKVVEYNIFTTNKGDALNRIKEQLSPALTLFIGDDVTDEAALERAEVSIKVGNEETLAKYRFTSYEDVVVFLVKLSEQRTEWLRAFPESLIDEHIFLSDLRSVALVDKYASVTWLCSPRVDSTPLFGSLVGGPGSGYFRINCNQAFSPNYIHDTLIGECSGESIKVTDFFDCSSERIYQRAGRSDLYRLIEGSGEVFIEFAPKFNFGRVQTRIEIIDRGLKIEYGQQKSVLYSPSIDWKISKQGIHDVATAKLVLNNQSFALVLLLGTASFNTYQPDINHFFNINKQFWNSWVSKLQLPTKYKTLVIRSALALRGLCFGPTGAISAAATTSLPESLGTGRNWDYRYCWPRDACLTASALLRLNSVSHGIKILDWLLEIVIDKNDESFIAPLYTVTGRNVPGEAEVPEAIGYRGSRPVRIGNLAAEQLQLDTLGPIAELMLKLVQKGATLTLEHLQLAERLVDLVNARWNEKDSGIWEIRGEQRHFVHSKVMCWYTVYCCYQVASYLGVDNEDWLKLADNIRNQIESQGYNEELNTYVAAYDLNHADAALLWVVLSGFHPPEHPRTLSTLDYVYNNLVHDESVYRYYFDDSLSGKEGEFIICRAWLIEALVMCGRKNEAQKLLEQMLSRINSIGLLSEQWDSNLNCALGNYPQAYSHLGLINAICALDLK
jgi:trehalose 6-phosphate phosphatase